MKNKELKIIKSYKDKVSYLNYLYDEFLEEMSKYDCYGYLSTSKERLNRIRIQMNEIMLDICRSYTRNKYNKETYSNEEDI